MTLVLFGLFVLLGALVGLSVWFGMLIERGKH